MSFLTRKHISRREVLKGAGATIALPLLDAMIPARTALAQTAAEAGPRLGFVYFPHGALQEEWQPTKVGRDFDFPFIIKPLEPMREYVTVVTGLRNKGGESASPHGIIEETWLNCVSPRKRDVKTGVGVTADQIAARHLGKETSLPSLELCAEPGGMISFRTPNQPLPMESNPRKVFFTMFGQGDTNEERRAILKTTDSLLDYVRESTASLNRKLDAADRARVSDYLDSVREIERRVQRLEENAQSVDLPGPIQERVERHGSPRVAAGRDERGVDRERVGPGGEAAVAAKAVEPGEDRQEGVLGAVLGGLIQIDGRAGSQPSDASMQGIPGGTQEIGAKVTDRGGLVLAARLEVAQPLLV